jgi:hypothetical protein
VASLLSVPDYEEAPHRRKPTRHNNMADMNIRLVFLPPSISPSKFDSLVKLDSGLDSAALHRSGITCIYDCGV